MKLFFLTIFLVTGSFCYAENLSLSIQTEPNSVIAGLPVRIVLKLQGHGKFTLPELFSIFCNENTSLGVRDSTGNRADWSFGSPCPIAEKSPLDSNSKAEYEGSTTTSDEIYLRPGTYSLRAFYHSSGPFWDRYSDTDKRSVTGIWEGQITSNTISVTVTAPTGEDQRAIAGLLKPDSTADDYAGLILNHRLELLKDYPNSTYSAFIVFSALPPVETINPKKFKQLMDTVRHYPYGGAVPDKDSPTGWREIPDGTPAAKWQIQKAEEILNLHPDFPFSDRLNLLIGVNKLYLGKKDEAIIRLQRVAQKRNTKEANWATEFMTLMQQQEQRLCD